MRLMRWKNFVLLRSSGKYLYDPTISFLFIDLNKLEIYIVVKPVNKICFKTIYSLRYISRSLKSIKRKFSKFNIYFFYHLRIINEDIVICLLDMFSANRRHCSSIFYNALSTKERRKESQARSHGRRSTKRKRPSEIRTTA